MQLQYKFTPNIPANLLEESQIAGNVDGIVSHETQLKTLSIVENVQNELDKIEAESEEQEDKVMSQMFRSISKTETVPGQEGNNE